MTTLISATSRLVFALMGGLLIIYAAALIVIGLVDLFRSEGPAAFAVLDSISYVVIAIAVFDVAKYLLEEEVLRERQMRAAGEARRSLTRFVGTIIIAILLEAVVILFKTVRTDVAALVYPTLLILAGCGMILSLGIYLRLSATLEQVTGEAEGADDGQ